MSNWSSGGISLSVFWLALFGFLAFRCWCRHKGKK